MNAAEHEAAIGRLLAELGDTADKVADALRAKGIKGVRESTACCPVARLLIAEGYEDVDVDADITAARDGEFLLVDLKPTAVDAFIERFDDGVYLDLVEVDG